MFSLRASLLVVGAALALSTSALADTTTVVFYDPNAPTSNFQNPGNTATAGYTINTSDNGSAVVVAFTTTFLNAPDFANLYFETNAYDTTMGSNLGFEASGTDVNDAFDPDSGIRYSLAGLTGFSSVETFGVGTKTITVTLPNYFFLTNPLNMPFPKNTDGAVSLHLSQTFGYSVAGGSAAYPRPAELGLAVLPTASPVPEPSTIEYMALSGFGALLEAGRRFRNRARV